MFGSIFDAIGSGISWVADQVTSIFDSGPSATDAYEQVYQAGSSAGNYGSSSGGAFDWLQNKGFQGAMAGGAKALLSPRGSGGSSGGGGVSYAGRLSANVAADRLPVQAMGDARGPRAITSEEPNTVDAYWSDRMRQFGRLSDTASAAKAK
jgi:hypothetical protein